MRVLHLIDSLAVGGAERMAVSLCNAWNDIGGEAWLCATRSLGPLAKLVNEGRVVCLGKKHTLDLVAFGRLVKFARCHKIQIVHAHSSSLGWGVALKAVMGVRVVWHDHYGDSEFLGQRRKTVLRLLCRWVDHVVSVNRRLAAWAREELGIPENRVSYIPNFTTVKKMTKRGRAGGEETPVIVNVANLRPQKDQVTLLRAVALLKEWGLKYQLIIVGSDSRDEYAREVKRLAKVLGVEESVQFLGERDDIEEILSNADIGVLSSRSEGLPVALLEYGAAGLAVVATDVGSCREVLEDGRVGLVVPPEDPHALANALATLLRSPQLRVRLGMAFHERVRQVYSVDAVIGQFQEIYARITHHRAIVEQWLRNVDR